MCSRHFGAKIGLVETLVPLLTRCGSLNDLPNFTEAHVCHLLNVRYQHMLGSSLSEIYLLVFSK